MVAPAAPAAPARIPYLTQDALAQMVRETRKRKRVTDGLAVAVGQIARGVNAARGYHGDDDEFAQECVVKLCKAWRRLDTNRHLFNYLTKLCENVGRSLRQKTERAVRAEQSMRDLVATGRLGTVRDLAELPAEYRRLHRLILQGKQKEAERLAARLIVSRPPGRAD